MLIQVIMDHKNLKYFMTTKKLIKYQIYQAKFLLNFNFVIFYIPDKKNPKKNFLTYW